MKVNPMVCYAPYSLRHAGKQLGIAEFGDEMWEGGYAVTPHFIPPICNPNNCILLIIEKL
jgi:hypothetical protein